VDKLVALDQHGQERDWDWLVANFGALDLARAEVGAGQEGAFRLVQVQAAEGPAVLVVHVTGRDGKPLENVAVVRSWPNAPRLPAWPAPASTWREQGVFGPTNAEGNLGFGLGATDEYNVPEAGPGAVWVADAAGPSDLIGGLGLIESTDHRHLNLFFRFEPSDAPVSSAPTLCAASPRSEPPPPPAPSSPLPSDEQWTQLFEKLDLIIEMLQRRGSL